MNFAILGNYGIDCEMGVSRCMDDEEFYASMLTMFLEDDAFPRAKAAYEGGDRVALFKCAHELKGVSGNVALTELYGALCPLVELVRDGGAAAAQGDIDMAFAKAEAAYIRTKAGIALAAGKQDGG